MGIRSVLVAAVALTAITAQAEPPFTAPVVQLYQERLELEKLEVDKDKIKLDYLRDRQLRLESISGAVSEASILEARKERALAEVVLKAQAHKVKQAAALLEIARQRVAAGQEMPFCFRD